MADSSNTAAGGAAGAGDEPKKAAAGGKAGQGKAERVHPAQIFAEDMTDEWSKDAVKAARDAFALTIATGDVHATIADFIRKKFDRDHDRGWNCVVGRSFGAFVTHEIKTYIYFTVQPGIYILLWRS
jgi:hypothetical protein